VVPWSRLEALISPHYSKPRKGRPQFPLGVMLRIYFLQQWYGLSDPAAEEGLYDMHSMRDFAGLDLGHDAIPDETTILNFRHLLEKHKLTEALFDAVKTYLEDRALLLRGGTIMDATLIAASPSTKNEARKRDPDMSQSKKGNQWYFGPPLVVCEQTTAGQRKAHIGVDAKTGLVHTVKTTTGKVHDAKLTDDLIRADDAIIFGDKGYVSDKRKRATRAQGAVWAVKDKRKPGRILSMSQKKRNKKYGTVRAKVEHVFRVINANSAIARFAIAGWRKTRRRCSALWRWPTSTSRDHV